MYAVVSRTTDPTPRLEQMESVPLGPTDVRVRVAAAGFTLFDAFSAANHALLGLPEVIGHGFDFSGTVLETGTDVNHIHTGDPVAGVHADATAVARAHATDVVVPGNDLARVPAELTLEQAAAVPLNALTARQGMDLLGARRGRLLVTGGAGSVGGWSIALARREGWVADALVRVGTEHLALGVGAVKVLTSMPERQYDAVIDTAALGAEALRAVVDGGQYVSVKPGRAPEAERGITVGTVLNHPDGAMLATLLQIAAVQPALARIAARRPLSAAADAYAEAIRASGSDGRWLLIP